MSVWLPPRAEQERMQQHNQQLQHMLATHARLQEWTRELKQIDERLELVLAQEGATAPGLKPGYYHVLRNNPGGPPSLIVVEDERGGFKEPDSSLFNKLKEMDCWDARVLRDREEIQRRIAEAAERHKQSERRAQAEEIVERVKANNSPGVSMTNAGKWAYRAGARRG